MIDDSVVDDDGMIDDEVDDDHRNDAAYDGSRQSIDDSETYDDDDNDDDTKDNTFDAKYGHDGSDSEAGPDRTELDLLQRVFPEIPESQTLDTKGVSKSIRGGATGISLIDQFGTGELFDDESSAVASVAVLGIVLVIIMVSCLYASFRHSMVVTPTNKNGSSKQGKIAMTSFAISKRRE